MDLSRTGHVVRVREIRNTYKILKATRIGRLRREWEDKKTDLRERGCEDVDRTGPISPLMGGFGITDVEPFRFCCHSVNKLV
jgi:hypothetical protein